MSLTPISEDAMSFTSVASLIKVTANGNRFFEGRKITKEQFLQTWTEVGRELGAERPDGSHENAKLSKAIAPVLFNMLDADKNGVLEEPEFDLLKRLLAFFDPEILRPRERPAAVRAIS